MAVAVRGISGSLEDSEIRERAYCGDILIFKDVEPMKRFCSFADSLIREVFRAEDPLRAQFEMGEEDFSQRAEELRTVFSRAEKADDLLGEALHEVGVDLSSTFWDRSLLRISPHGDGFKGRDTVPLGFHRDTWASNVYSQLNWWAPVYEIESGRTIAFYPEYWQNSLKNTSADWDLEELRVGKPLPLVPEPSEYVSTSSEIRVILDPGDLLCFSGAHLHASVPNNTGIPRFSVEFRSANAEDEARGLGAPNPDGYAPHTALGWFRHVQDGHNMSDTMANKR